jgi:hypothetical protein
MPLDRPVPPAGEEIHIPGGSLQPLLLTIGITVALLGVTVSFWLLTLPGLVLCAAVLVVWIREAVDEYRHLPLDHNPVVADTVPDPGNRPDAGTASSH